MCIWYHRSSSCFLSSCFLSPVQSSMFPVSLPMSSKFCICICLSSMFISLFSFVFVAPSPSIYFILCIYAGFSRCVYCFVDFLVLTLLTCSHRLRFSLPSWSCDISDYPAYDPCLFIDPDFCLSN